MTLKSYTINQMADDLVAHDWLETLTWRDAWMTMEALEPAILPPYLGSTLRGALGHLLRVAMCDGSGCGHECQKPDACRYYALFEKSKGSDGKDLPKSFIILTPTPIGLDAIAAGGPVNLPYRTGPPLPGESIPTLDCEAQWDFEAGATFTFGIRIFGIASSVLPAVLQRIAETGLVVGTSRFALAIAKDHWGQALYDRRQSGIPAQLAGLQRFVLERETAKRLRVLFLLPTAYKPMGETGPTFSPESLAAGFFKHGIGRAKEVCRALSRDNRELPRIEAPLVELCGHRLFHYRLQRRSYRQGKQLEYDGVVGFLDLQGELTDAMPWARAAEVLHFGERSTAGLGKVRVMVIA